MDDALNFSNRLKSDGPLLGLIATMPAPPVTRLLAAAGFDWLMIDLEHAPIDSSAMQAMVAATAGTGCAPFVRVPSHESPYLKHALDAGAMGIVFPMIRNAAEAEMAVAGTLYPPAGKRGWGPFFAPSRWGLSNADYQRKADGLLTRIVLIEHPDALENLAAILAVPGVDVALLAPNDLSLNMGYPGQPDHPRVAGALETAERIILDSGIALGGVARDIPQAREKLSRGYRVLVLGHEGGVLNEAAVRLLGGIRRVNP